MVEPLHELKNVINRVFDELPYAVTDTDLKSAINEMLKALKGTLWSVWNSLSSNCSLSYVFIIIINIYAVISYCPLPNTYMYFKRSVLRMRIPFHNWQVLQNSLPPYMPCFSVENSEMKGTKCRLNLILITLHLSKQEKTRSTREGQKVLTMLLALVEIQKIAYSLESARSPKSILRCLNLCFIFGILSIEIFEHPVKTTRRSLFGMPFHSLVNHLPVQLRLVNGRSIVAEQAERHFNKMRYGFVTIWLCYLWVKNEL